MPNRIKRVEQYALQFLQSLPPDLLIYPFDIYKAISTLKNCKIHSYQKFAKNCNCSISDVIELCESNTGATHRSNDKYIIMYNNSQSIIKQRKQFTLAHELGHIYLNHFKAIVKSQIAQGDSKEVKLEREANYFAACILCPAPISYKERHSSALELQKYFNISLEAAEIAWKDYKHYNPIYNIAWHNDMIKLFTKHNS